MTTRTILTCLIALPLLTSCVKQGDLDSLNSRMAQNEQRMQHLTSQVGNVEQVLPGQAEMWAQMQAIRQELNMVRGQLDEINAGGGHEAGSQGARLTAIVNRLETAVRQMASELGVQVEALNAPLETTANAAPAKTGETPGTQTGSANGTEGAGTPGTQTPPPPSLPADTATNLYDSGMNAFASRNYNGSVKAFTDFAAAFPKHKLASNAHFWRGESFYQLKNYTEAILAYQEVIGNFPGSSKLQAAMLKQGMALYSLNKKEAGRQRLNELVQKYPSSPEAGRAKKFMQQNK